MNENFIKCFNLDNQNNTINNIYDLSGNNQKLKIFLDHDWLKYYERSAKPNIVLSCFDHYYGDTENRKLSPKSFIREIIFPPSPKRTLPKILSRADTTFRRLLQTPRRISPKSASPSATPRMPPSPPSRSLPLLKIPRFGERPNTSRLKKRSANTNKRKITLKKIGYRVKTWISFGINNYKHLPKLDNAANDAQKLHNFSKSTLGFEQGTVIKNKNVTKKRIEYEIKDHLYKNSQIDDLVVISFHGHGITLKTNGIDDGFIAPYDAPENPTPADLISMDDLSNWTKYIPARHVLILLDCCFSGFMSLQRCIDKEKDTDYSEYTFVKMLSKRSRIAINAGTQDQKVSDGGWGKNSIFTGGILSFPGFKKKKGSVCALYNYLLETVPKYYPQTPTLGKLIGDEGGDMFLSL